PRREAESESERRAEAMLRRILYWTGGHPYLTQKLCQATAEALTSLSPTHPSHTPTQLVDAVCASTFLSHRAQDRDDNLNFVRERLLAAGNAREEDLAALLTLYRQICSGRRVPDDERNPLVNVLRLSGVVAVHDRAYSPQRRKGRKDPIVPAPARHDLRQSACIGGFL